MKGYSPLPRAPRLEPHYQTWCHPVRLIGRFLTLCRDAVGLFCCPSWLGCASKTNYLKKIILNEVMPIAKQNLRFFLSYSVIFFLNWLLWCHFFTFQTWEIILLDLVVIQWEALGVYSYWRHAFEQYGLENKLMTITQATLPFIKFTFRSQELILPVPVLV